MKEQYTYLVALLQLYIFQEYPQNSRIECKGEDFSYFKDFAIKLRMQGQKAPIQEKHLDIPIKDQILYTNEENPPNEENSPKIATFAPKKTSATPFLSLNPMRSAPPPSVYEFTPLFSEKFPHLSIKNNIPDDKEAQKNAKNWNQKKNENIEVIILYSSHLPETHRNFLIKVSEVLSERKRPTMLITHSNYNQESLINMLSSPSFRLAIVQSGLKVNPEDFFSLHTPVLLLQDISDYLQDPQQKRKLWQDLKAKLKL